MKEAAFPLIYDHHGFRITRPGKRSLLRTPKGTIGLLPMEVPGSCVTPAELLFVAIAVAGDAAERSRKERQGGGRPDEKPMQSALPLPPFRA
jgi:hypothetical protein